MGIKSLFNKKKVEQNKKFQENLNTLGEKLANCKTIDEINTLKHDQLVADITGELEKDRDKKSDSKNLLDKFKPAFNAFFNNVIAMKDDNFEIRCDNLLKACDRLEKAGKQKNISSIAVIKNIDMTGLTNCIKICQKNIKKQPNNENEDEQPNAIEDVKEIRQDARSLEKKLRLFTFDGSINKKEDAKIDAEIFNLLDTLKPYMSTKSKIKLAILRTKLNKTSNIVTELGIVNNIIGLLEKDAKLKSELTLKSEALKSFSKITQAYTNSISELTSEGKLTQENLNTLSKLIDDFDKELEQSVEDGELTSNEILKLKEDINEIVDNSPLKQEDKADILKKLEADFKEKDDPEKALKVIENILNEIISKTPTKEAKKQVQEKLKPIDEALDNAQNKIDEHNEENNDDKGAGTAGEKVINDLGAIVKKVPANGVSFEVARDYTVKMVKVLIDTSIFNAKQIKFIGRKTTAIQEADNLHDLNNEVTQIAAMIKNEGRNQDPKQLEIADKLIDGVNYIAKKVDSTKHMQIESSESVDLKKKQEAIEKELKNLWVIDNNSYISYDKKENTDSIREKLIKGIADKKIKKAPTALDVATSGKMEPLYTHGRLSSWGPYYVLVDKDGKIHQDSLKHDNKEWKSINSTHDKDAKQATAEVVEYLKSVLTTGKF